MVGLAALYRGFAIGAMGIVAPISAASPIVPLAVDTANGRAPTPTQWAGIALVVSGIVALSREPSVPGRPRVAAGAGLALVAALGFGLFFLGIDAGADKSTAWAVAAARGASVPIRPDRCPRNRGHPAAGSQAAPDARRGRSVRHGRERPRSGSHTAGAVGIVAVLGSLYPVTTILLAWLVLGERLGTSKRVGGGVALVGAALVAVG